MALAAQEDAFNTASLALMDAWETLVDDGLAAGEEIRIVWCKSRYGDNASDGAQGSDATALFDPTGRCFYWTNNPDTTADVPLEIGGRPLFFMVTNAAGDLTA